MPLPDRTSRELAAADVTVTAVEDLVRYPQANLARGIVWADVLADIAADEAARQRLRDAA